MIGKRSKKGVVEEKVLDVNASMQGNMIFKDPVNLKINGTFEGNLTTKGSLTIGETAEVNADIIGENIIVAGRVTGDIIAEKSLKIIAPARIIGDVKTPNLAVAEGAILHGNCYMIFEEAEISRITTKTKKNVMSVEEVARFLEVDTSLVIGWADSGKLPGRKEEGKWQFDRAIVDEWIKNEKIR